MKRKLPEAPGWPLPLAAVASGGAAVHGGFGAALSVRSQQLSGCIAAVQPAAVQLTPSCPRVRAVVCFVRVGRCGLIANESFKLVASTPKVLELTNVSTDGQNHLKSLLDYHLPFYTFCEVDQCVSASASNLRKNCVVQSACVFDGQVAVDSWKSA